MAHIWKLDMHVGVCTCYSYTMDTSGLPDMYTLSPRVYISGKPRVDMV